MENVGLWPVFFFFDRISGVCSFSQNESHQLAVSDWMKDKVFQQMAAAH